MPYAFITSIDSDAVPVTPSGWYIKPLILIIPVCGLIVATSNEGAAFDAGGDAAPVTALLWAKAIGEVRVIHAAMKSRDLRENFRAGAGRGISMQAIILSHLVDSTRKSGGIL
jgi:hypothetical protein